MVIGERKNNTKKKNKSRAQSLNSTNKNPAFIYFLIILCLRKQILFLIELIKIV